jgi:DNA-directed RNA polymerase specialized sigma24 family protein
MATTATRAERVATFYARQADHLQRIVAARVNAPAQTIEDACQHAWVALLRRDDVAPDERSGGWLYTVTIHEGWRLARRRAREVPMGAMRNGDLRDGELPEPVTVEFAPDERTLTGIGHAARVADLRTLKPRERRDLYLQALGYSYNEIAALSGAVWCHRRVPSRACLDDMSSRRLGAVHRPLASEVTQWT